MIRLFQQLARVDQELRALRLPWALVGGLAVSMRGEARTTRDIDIALVTRDDREAETIIRRLQERGYRLESLREQKRAFREKARLVCHKATRQMGRCQDI